MSIIEINGFKVYSDLDGTKSIIINSDHIKECMQIYIDNDLDGVAITTSHGYELQNVDFLFEYPDVKHISISEGIKDIDAVYSLSKLESLMLSGSNRKFDFSCFPALKKLNVDWSSNFIGIDKCLHLSDLSIYKYNPESKDCLPISKLQSIKRLNITQSTIYTLNGLNECCQLEKLELNYCSKLDTLCCFEGSRESLTSLLFDHCKSIKNYDYVGSFRHLNELAFNNCGIMPSIKFIKNNKLLNSFRFMGTDVIDGDMTPCINLRYTSFSNKKHFSHTMKEISRLSDSTLK